MGLFDDLLGTTGLFGNGNDLGLPEYVPLDYLPEVDANNANYLKLIKDLVVADSTKAQKVYDTFRNVLRKKWAYDPVYGKAAPRHPGVPEDVWTYQFWATRANTSAQTYGKEVLQKWADGGVLERALNFMKLWKSVLDGPLSGFPEDKPWYKISSKTLWAEEQYPYFKFFEETAKQGWYPRGLAEADRPRIDAEAAKAAEEAAKPWDPLGLGGIKETGKTLLMVGAVILGVALLLSVAD
jgi:hypothetical protein